MYELSSLLRKKPLFRVFIKLHYRKKRNILYQTLKAMTERVLVSGLDIQTQKDPIALI